MILTKIVFKRRLHFNAVGAAFDSLDGPAEVIGPWVKVRVPRGAGGFAECLVWGEDIWPAEIVNDVPAMVAVNRRTRDPIVIEESDPIMDVLGEK